MTVQPGARPGAARQRVLDAAVPLFSEHGLSGTSLQMIADTLGVTKAAVYHQFHTKEDIALAVVAPVFEQLAAIVDAGEAKRSRNARVETVVEGLVALVVQHRQLTAMLHGDPAFALLVHTHEPLEQLGQRLVGLLTGPDPDPQTRVRTAMVAGGIMLSGMDPLLADLDAETLRHELLAVARRMLGLRAR